jgi:hypothetical protein
METNTEAYLYHDPTKENIWVEAVLNGLGQKKNAYYKVSGSYYSHGRVKVYVSLLGGFFTTSNHVDHRDRQNGASTLCI